MYTKVIKYEDYDGNQRTMEAHFHLNKAELIEMQASWDGGLEKVLKMIILKSYGIKSLDGNRFQKSPEITAEFTQTEAYSELFMELATNDQAAAEFVNGILPKDMIAEAEKAKSAVAEITDQANK